MVLVQSVHDCCRDGRRERGEGVWPSPSPPNWTSVPRVWCGTHCKVRPTEIERHADQEPPVIRQNVVQKMTQTGPRRLVVNGGKLLVAMHAANILLLLKHRRARSTMLTANKGRHGFCSTTLCGLQLHRATSFNTTRKTATRDRTLPRHRRTRRLPTGPCLSWIAARAKCNRSLPLSCRLEGCRGDFD